MRPRSLVRAAVLAALVSLALPAAPALAGPAVHPDNRPTPVPGRSNGKLQSGDLITVQPSCVAYRPAAASLALLLDAARHEGVDLGTTECYRPLDNQVRERQRFGPCAAPPGTSQHGWGKAVDLRDSRGGLTFSSPAFRWLQDNAWAYGWNHPGWARPGGGGCDEPWHWEWVGDGGAMGGTPVEADVMGVVSQPAGGWWSFTGLGAVTAGGGAPSHGGAEGVPLSRLVVGGAATPDGGGYWLVAADGGVFAFGDARYFGSMGGRFLHRPIVGMAATASGLGYWLVASDGGMFAFGDAGFYGSMGGSALNRPMVGMAATPSGLGYWLVASDGGVFTYGDAAFAGSTGGMRLNRAVVGMAAAGPGAYWLAASDGGVFSFGG
ncbi:MAG TPA: M15 family metallopeptidase, partial [Acidimicrobiales bacterium]|nr:M15 family metallopeptidase [Acidimicrobiales bacterium]